MNHVSHSGWMTAPPQSLHARLGSSSPLTNAGVINTMIRSPSRGSKRAVAVGAAAGVELDRRHIELGEQIKSLGEHAVVVHLHPEVEATFTINVVAK